MDLKEKIKDLRGSLYFEVDRNELGKMMVLVSATLLLVSIHSFRGYDQAANSLDRANTELEQASNLIQSDRFEQSMGAVESVRGFNPSESFNQVIDAFDSAESAVNKTQQAEETVKDRRETYQWYSLIGVLGIVAGIAVIYS